MFGFEIIINNRTPIGPSSNEKLLGCWVDENLKWSEHIRDNKENLILALTTRLGALKKIGQVASFKNRQMLAIPYIHEQIIILDSFVGRLWHCLEEDFKDHSE